MRATPAGCPTSPISLHTPSHTNLKRRTHHIAREHNKAPLVLPLLERVDLEVALHVQLPAVPPADAHADGGQVRLPRRALARRVVLRAERSERLLQEREQRVGRERGEEAREVRRVAEPRARLRLGLCDRGNVSTRTSFR